MSNYGLIRLKRFILSFTAKLCNWFFSLTTFNASYICLKIWCDGESWKILGTKHGLSHIANEIVICWLDCKWDRHLLAGSSHFYCFPRYIQGVVFADHSYKHRSYFIWRCALLGLELGCSSSFLLERTLFSCSIFKGKLLFCCCTSRTL